MKEETLVYEKDFSITKDIYFFIKRCTDILMSFMGILFLIPMTIVIKIVYILGGDFTSIFFRQKRVGKNGKFIYIFKFRTMVPNAEALLKKMIEEDPKVRDEYYKNRKLDKDPRITKIGNILRKTSLDEFPQFINIFIGDMSLIGPRPVLEDESQQYGSERSKFLSVRPGLTGYWACNGRSCTSYEERIALELYYIDNCSPLLDLKIVVLTIIRVIQSKGAI